MENMGDSQFEGNFFCLRCGQEENPVKEVESPVQKLMSDFNITSKPQFDKVKLKLKEKLANNMPLTETESLFLTRLKKIVKEKSFGSADAWSIL
jgi:hypothetical protein